MRLSAAPAVSRHAGLNCGCVAARWKNGVRFTYPASVIDLVLAGRCAGRTPAKRWVLASTIARGETGSGWRNGVRFTYTFEALPALRSNKANPLEMEWLAV